MEKLRKSGVDQLSFSEDSLINTSQETTKYRTRHIKLLLRQIDAGNETALRNVFHAS